MTNQTNRPRPVALIVLDGWGVNPHYTGNSITLAKTPNFTSFLSEYPCTTIRASGESVGLPWGEQGNSEVGHLNLGLGRIMYQDLPRINKSIGEGQFYHNEILLAAVDHAKRNNSKFHIMGLVSTGCVHSSIDHLHALLVLAKEHNLEKVFVHVILDGRDTPFNSGANFVKGVEKSMNEYSVGKIATISGRFYTMDRNNNWDRVAKAYLAMTEGVGNEVEDPIKAIENSYKKKIYDEEFVPTVIKSGEAPVGLIEDNDVLVFFNFRPDRARQITNAFITPDFNKFKRNKFLDNLFFVAFTEYEKDQPVNIAFPPQTVNNTLGEIISKAKLNQLRIAETEKYAHVTYFFNGGREEKSPGEDHVLIPSPSVSSYDQKPEMSANEVTKKLIEGIQSDKYDFILVNFANADMVGHTGNLEAGIKAVETVDKCLGKIVKEILDRNGVLFITADHGNAEIMFNLTTGQIDKEHTTNPVPFIVIGKEYRGKNIGWPNLIGEDLSLMQPQGNLADVAPTILKIMNLKKPKEMTGISML